MAKLVEKPICKISPENPICKIENRNPICKISAAFPICKNGSAAFWCGFLMLSAKKRVAQGLSGEINFAFAYHRATRFALQYPVLASFSLACELYIPFEDFRPQWPSRYKKPQSF